MTSELGHKANFNKYQRITIILAIFSDLNEIKFEVKSKEIAKITSLHLEVC